MTSMRGSLKFSRADKCGCVYVPIEFRPEVSAFLPKGMSDGISGETVSYTYDGLKRLTGATDVSGGSTVWDADIWL